MKETQYRSITMVAIKISMGRYRFYILGEQREFLGIFAASFFLPAFERFVGSLIGAMPPKSTSDLIKVWLKIKD